MTIKPVCTAQVVFHGERFVSLPKVADLATQHLRRNGASHATVTEASLTGLVIETEVLAVTLDLAFVSGETVLTVGLALPDGTDDAAALADLAALLYPLAQSLPATDVVWAGSDLRIPRDTFLQRLADMFGPRDPDPAPAVSQIAPRRVARKARAKAPARPVAPACAALLRALPPVAPDARVATANDNAPLGSRHYNAHVKAYERHMRAAFLRPADEAELEALREAEGIIPTEARLSTWAVSLSIAVISLPVAAPVMIYNLARGEDFRVASLAMGLAGMFVALDSTGASALIGGF